MRPWEIWYPHWGEQCRCCVRRFVQQREVGEQHWPHDGQHVQQVRCGAIRQHDRQGIVRPVVHRTVREGALEQPHGSRLDRAVRYVQCGPMERRPRQHHRSDVRAVRVGEVEQHPRDLERRAVHG